MASPRGGAWGARAPLSLPPTNVCAPTCAPPPQMRFVKLKNYTSIFAPYLLNSSKKLKCCLLNITKTGADLTQAESLSPYPFSQTTKFTAQLSRLWLFKRPLEPGKMHIRCFFFLENFRRGMAVDRAEFTNFLQVIYRLRSPITLLLRCEWNFAYPYIYFDLYKALRTWENAHKDLFFFFFFQKNPPALISIYQYNYRLW